MAEGVAKKNKKRRHSQIDDDDELPSKVSNVTPSKARAKPALPGVEDQSPPLSEPGEKPDDCSNAKDVKTKKKFRFPKRPVNKSWVTHIAAVIISKLVDDMVLKVLDPRQDPERMITDGFSLSCEDVKKFWYYISKEYPSSSFTLNEILTELAPLHKVTPADIMNQETLLKYKDQIPKPPVTAYLQFVKSKQSKLREKHPELGQVDVTRRLAQKWKEIGPERRNKYIQRYEHLRKQYKTEIEEFYSEHPDARPHVSGTPRKTKKIAKDSVFDSETDKRYKKLKLLAPKPPVTAYFLFVNAKRGRYKDKHPNLKPSEITKKLADKWHALSAERQGKYKKVYDENYKEYKAKLDEFYSRYPDAQELFKRKRGTPTKRKTPATIATPPAASVTESTSVQPSSSSSLTVTTTTTTNSLPTHEMKTEEESEEEEEEDSGDSSSSNSDDSESSSDEQEEVDSISTSPSIL